MNKTLFFWIFWILSSSCQKKTDSYSQEDSKAVNTISVIIDDQLWNSEVGDSIRNKFASPVLGLPQEEPLFTLKQYPAKLFEGFSTGSRNMIIIKKGNFNRYEMRVNEFSTPQNTIHITGKSTDEILFLLEKHYQQVIKKMRDAEISECQKIFSDSLIDTKKIQNKFNIELSVPFGYETVLSRKKLIWLKKEITSGNASILIYQIPMSNLFTSRNITKSIIKTRDSIGSLYIRGMGTNSPMITEDSYAPYLFRTRIAGRETYETKGTWELRNDYMSGPFINYHLIDRSRKRILVIEGFCYDPSEAKRDIMFELEAIIKSVEFLKKTNRK